MATFAKTATKGTTIMPEPSSAHTCEKDNVRLWYSIWNGGNEASGIPGSTLPVNSK